MLLSTKIFTTHSKPDLAEPSERMVLVREGFSVWAFLFTLLWLIAQRLWIATVVYLLIEVGIVYACQRFGFSDVTLGMLQLFLQLMLGFSAYDLKRLSLKWRGYALSGVVAAETPLNAARRYYDYVA